MKKLDRIERARNAGKVITKKKVTASRMNGQKGGRPPEWLRKGLKRFHRELGISGEMNIAAGRIILEEWKQTKEGKNHD